MARRAKPSSLSCEMVRRPKVFIIFSFEKERSALARDWQYSDIAVIELKRATNIERSGGRGGQCYQEKGLL